MGFSVIIHHPKFSNNVGMIVRTADLFGADKVIISDGSRVDSPNAADTGKAWRRLGAVTNNLSEALALFPDHRIVGVEMDISSTPLPDYHHPEDNAVYVLGSEDHGLSDSERLLMDDMVVIPVGEWSFNVAQSIAMVLYDRFNKNHSRMLS